MKGCVTVVVLFAIPVKLPDAPSIQPLAADIAPGFAVIAPGFIYKSAVLAPAAQTTPSTEVILTSKLFVF